MQSPSGSHGPITVGVLAAIWLVVWICIGIYAAAMSSGWSIFTGGTLVALGSAAIGIFLGLLFGIPRSGDQSSNADTQPRLVTNNSLDQIIDWLTKILVGLGLTQIFDATSKLQALGNYLAPVFGGTGSSAIFAVGVVLSSVVIGFLGGFVWAKLILSPDLADALAYLLNAARQNKVDEVVDEKAKAAGLTRAQTGRAKGIARSLVPAIRIDNGQKLDLSELNLDNAFLDNVSQQAVDAAST